MCVCLCVVFDSEEQLHKNSTRKMEEGDVKPETPVADEAKPETTTTAAAPAEEVRSTFLFFSLLFFFHPSFLLFYV